MVFSFIIISTATIQYIKVPEVLSWIVDSSSRILLEHSFQFLQSRKIVVEEITFKEVLPAASWAKASRFYQNGCISSDLYPSVGDVHFS